MANIYLRVPTYVAQFYRGRDPKHPMAENDPVVFSEFQHEHVLMASALMYSETQDSRRTLCFSQREWKNMMRGKTPDGSQQILRRDPQEWLNTKEVCLLTGERTNSKTGGYDYLCIEIPRVIVVGQQLVSTNASFTLTAAAAAQLAQMIRSEFIRVFLDWVRQERFWCNQQGIRRTISTVIDHFFYHYNICIGTNGRDRDTMRRMASRWIEEAQTLPNDRLPWEDEDAQYVYLDEKEQQTEMLDDMLKELNSQVKET